MPDYIAPSLAVVVGLAATIIWGVMLGRTVNAYHLHIEHRLTWMTMALGAFCASVGTLASAVGFAVQRGYMPELIPQDAWSFIASVGRGALLAAGLIVITHYRPPHSER